MDFLNKAYAQISDVFSSMTPGARITSGLLLIAVLVSVGYLFHYRTGYGDTFLFDGREFSQQELASMEAAFARKGLNNWTSERNRIRIPRGQKFEYIAALADDNAMPEDFDLIMEEMIKNDSPFVSKQLRELQQRYVDQKQMGLIISKMEGIERAAVKISRAAEGGLSRRHVTRALAAVKAKGNQPLTEQQVHAIRNAVMAAEAGLKTEDITVLDQNSGRSWPGTSWNGLPHANENIYAAHQRMFEQELRDSIYEYLHWIPGIVVGVHAELLPELNHRTSTMKYEQPTAMETETYQKELSSSSPAPGGRPGTVPNGVTSNQPAQIAQQEGARETINESSDKARNIAGQEQVIVEKAPLTPTRVKATIAIPTSYFTKVWHQLNDVPGQKPQTPQAMELIKIEEDTKRAVETAVVQILPWTPPGVDPYPLVQVSTYVETSPEPLPEITTSDVAMSWLGQNWQTLVMVGVGLLSLLMLRGMIRSGDRAAAAAAPPGASDELAGEPEDEEEEQAKEEAISTLLQRRLKTSGGNLREELAEIVRHDPDGAANVLRNWIGDAA